MKSFLAIFAGIISGLAIWFLGLMVFSSLFPYPFEISISDRTAYQDFINTLPTKAYIVKIVTNSFSIFAAGLVGSIIGKNWRVRSGLIAILPFMTYFIVSDFQFTYPTYYVVCNISLIILFAFASIFYGSTRVISG